jgi:hypothetical protein
MNETNLILGFSGLPPKSARNCTQELSPIPNGEFKKSINGELLFLETTERKRYRSVISCRDTNSPIISGIWVGSQILVGCIQNLWQVISPGELGIKLIRPAVDQSICVINSLGDAIKFKSTKDEVELHKTYKERVFVGFRPWLTMKVIDFSLETDEWGTSGN